MKNRINTDIKEKLAMNMHKQRLRFPQFCNSPSWVERKFVDILNEHKYKSTGKEEVYSVSVHKGLINQVEHLGRSYAAATTDHYNRVLPGDIVYTKSPTGDFPLGIIKQSKIAYPVIVSPLYGVFTPETYALGTILNAYFESPINVSNYLAPIVKKGAKNTINITNTTFLSRALFLPTDKKEQQKIAGCLTTLDNLISAESQKFEALKDHKKWLMQNLFPVEGETVPKVRFSGFRGDWEKTSLGDIAIITSGGTPLRSREEYWNGNVPWITTSLIDFNTILEAEEYISTLGMQESSAKLFPKDTILMAMYGQGITRGKVAILGIEATTNQACAAILLKNGFSTNFVFQYLAGRYEEIRALSNDGGQKNLSAGLIEKIPFAFPGISSSGKMEQQKIVECLSSLDKLIAAQSQKVAALKSHKKGLMQHLFPFVNEVVG